LLYKPEVKIIVISRSIGRSKTFFPEKNTEPNHFLEEKKIINTSRLILTNKKWRPNLERKNEEDEI
jgi:hypothetical protein